MPDYYINLIEPERIQDLSCFDKDLQMIFGMLKYRKDKKGLSEYVQKNREFFSKEGFCREKILGKLEKHFSLTEEQAEKYMDQFGRGDEVNED